MGSIYCWFRGSTSKSKGGERGRGTGGKSRSCQETVWTLCTRSCPSQVRAIKLRIALGVGDIIEKNYRQPIYRNFSNYRQIIDIENCIQFYSINTIESIVLKTRKVPRWLTEKLLVARDFWCSKTHTDSVMVLENCCEEHNSWACQTKYVVASPLMRILWNKYSAFDSTGV